MNATYELSDLSSDVFYDALHALPDSVILLDDKACVLWHNPAAKTLLTAFFTDDDTPDVLGKPILKLLANEYFIEAFSQVYQDFLLGKYKAEQSANFKFPSKIFVGDVQMAQVSFLPASRMLLRIQNYTRIHHLEQMRTDFVGNVSHELRTPLTVLMGYLETFGSAPDLSAKWQRGFNLMREQARRMNKIVNDLLMLSRLENDESEPPAAVDMPRVLMQVFDDAQASNAESAHLIDLHLDTPKNLLGLEVYLHSAILNLVLNAMKYTPAGGEISIIWEEVKDGALLSVMDNGIGIAPEHLTRLTERFYRVDSGRSRATGGTGLGLAIVKHVLNKHDARLMIESTEGEGSAFKVLFPKSRLV
ncbi:Phosphate regulon sensor protein phoR [Moraxella caviae]|uniref:phosphate regulon sensor histidine kinase PhoR n=1 Tax=Moraxella caviae TaxID=34060 RepID=UPI00101B2227|nr:phosphate regulon sensor histidine kinase PhoR [Moraxella caviae]VEW12589.1 Phosphate regulon sensor protein phoR [Moraxella caviae]